MRVKIITNRDAIRQIGGQGGGVQILSEQETNQFKDMIMSLLVSYQYHDNASSNLRCKMEEKSATRGDSRVSH